LFRSDVIKTTESFSRAHVWSAFCGRSEEERIEEHVDERVRAEEGEEKYHDEIGEEWGGEIDKRSDGNRR